MQSYSKVMDGGDHMLNINEEKALRYNKVHGHQCLGSFQSHPISAYFGNDHGVNSPVKFDDDDDGDRTVVVEDEDHDDDDDESGSNVSQDTEERTIYWELQDVLFKEILEHYSSTGTKFRKEISRLIEVANNEEETTNSSCKCRNPNKSVVADVCAKCFRQRVFNLLCNKGFNASLCTSRWTNTNKFPGGTHEYLEVIASTQSRKKKIAFVIELGFRDEFKMAKASDEYHALTGQLPEIFIGKSDHLNAMLRVICDAAKRSTSEKKMHLGPWRKRSFMQRKWSASQEKPSKTGPVASAGEEHVGFNRRFQFSAAAAVKVA